jgi:hypothetical protein
MDVSEGKDIYPYSNREEDCIVHSDFVRSQPLSSVSSQLSRVGYDKNMVFYVAKDLAKHFVLVLYFIGSIQLLVRDKHIPSICELT